LARWESSLFVADGGKLTLQTRTSDLQFTGQTKSTIECDATCKKLQVAAQKQMRVQNILKIAAQWRDAGLAKKVGMQLFWQRRSGGASVLLDEQSLPTLEVGDVLKLSVRKPTYAGD